MTTTPERNPDIKLDKEEIPSGLQLIEGKNMMQIARSKSIPFGVGTRVDGTGRTQRRVTVGLIIRNADSVRFFEALASKNERLAKSKP